MIDLETRKIRNNKGFTLVEILVSIAIFSLVFGAVASLYAANIKAQRKYLAAQQLLSEAGYVMNYMSSQLERGLTQGDSSCCCFPSNCSENGISYVKASYGGGFEGIKFVSHRGECVEFFSTSTFSEPIPRLYQQRSCNPYVLSPGNLTASKLVVEDFHVNVIRGTEKAPRVTLYLKMTTTGKEKTSIELQTTISKRRF